MIARQLFLAFIGLCAGAAVAGGVFALILSLGVVNRLAGKTHSAKHILLYEDSILLGAIIGCIVSLFPVTLPFGTAGELIFGLFAGTFTGCVAVTLAEELNVIPVLFRRTKIKRGVGLVIWSLAIGKIVGSLLQYMFSWKK